MTRRSSPGYRDVGLFRVAGIAIAASKPPRTGWEVSAIALAHGRGLLHRGPTVVPWDKCPELFEAGPLAEQLASLREMWPADLATAFGSLPPGRRGQVAAALDDEQLADLLEEKPEAEQVRVLASLGLEPSADVVEEMQPDDAADLLAEMPAGQRERLLAAMESFHSADLRRLLRYDATTAGGLMTSQPLVFTPDQPVAEVLARVRDPGLPVTSASQVYVCEPPTMTPTGRFLGSVGFQALLRQPPPPRSVNASGPAFSSGPISPSATWRPGWLRTTWSAWRCVTRMADWSARSPWTTCSTISFHQTGDGPESERCDGPVPLPPQ